MVPSVLVTDFVTTPDIEANVLSPHAKIDCGDAWSPSELRERIRNYQSLIAFHDIDLNASLLEQAERCEAVIRAGVGFDNVDLEAAGRCGIVVCNVPDYGTEEVADHALGLLLAMTRKIVRAAAATRKGEWDPNVTLTSPRHRGRTLGVLGCGRIGTALCLRAKPLGFRILIYDPYQPRGYEKAIGVERVHQLSELLSQSEFLSLHCYLSDETRNIINAETLNALPAGATIVNTARGGLIDEAALYDALESGQIAEAALDVMESEPPKDRRLIDHPRVIVTPHAAFNSASAGPEIRTKSAQEALRVVRSEPLWNPVNLQHLGSLKNPALVPNL